MNSVFCRILPVVLFSFLAASSVYSQGLQTTKPEDVGAVHYVAGLDPSGSGFQAAFLWAYQLRPELHMWMVDIENALGGGIARARETIRECETIGIPLPEFAELSLAAMRELADELGL